MKNNQNQKSDVPIIVAGTLLAIMVAVLTIFASKSLISKLNDNADKAYAEAVANVDAMRLASQKDSQTQDEAIIVHNYSVADIIEIDGKYYIRYECIESSDGEENNPIVVDPSETITIDGEDYALIDTQDPIETDEDVDTGHYLGEEYVVVDIDGNMVYLVKEGDTLTDISRRVAYSVDELAEFNHIKNVNLIYEGESLRIPASQEAIDAVKNKQNAE